MGGSVLKEYLMDKKHYNELVLLSQEICDQAADRLTNYCAGKYCGVGNDTAEQQLEDYLFVAEETSAYFLGNALALLDPGSREAEIRSFIENLQRIVSFAEKKMGSELLPEG